MMMSDMLFRTYNDYYLQYKRSSYILMRNGDNNNNSEHKLKRDNNSKYCGRLLRLERKRIEVKNFMFCIPIFC